VHRQPVIQYFQTDEATTTEQRSHKRKDQFVEFLTTFLERDPNEAGKDEEVQSQGDIETDIWIEAQEVAGNGETKSH